MEVHDVRCGEYTFATVTIVITPPLKGCIKSHRQQLKMTELRVKMTKLESKNGRIRNKTPNKFKTYTI